MRDDDIKDIIEQLQRLQLWQDTLPARLGELSGDISSFPATARATKIPPEKLERLLMYVRGTLDEFLTLGVDNLTIMKTWVDVSYGVHKDFKSHTGGGRVFRARSRYVQISEAETEHEEFHGS
jgi:hypothetical protein